MTEKFTWVEFYIELADRILTFKNNRGELIEKVREAHIAAGKALPKIESNNNHVPDIDPFTIFALFNRGKQGIDTRKALCAGFKSIFGLISAVPSDFDGIPMFNYNQYCFYHYIGNEKRDEKCFDILWGLFAGAIQYAKDHSNEDAFKKYFDDALQLDLVGMPKLTMGLFQIRPNTFINLDSVNKPLIEERTGMIIDVRSADDYIKLCAIISEHINASTDCDTFPEFSSLAYKQKTKDISNADNGWFPSKTEYDPEISKEQWIEFLEHLESCNQNESYIDFLSKMLDIGCQATCAQLADKYGNTAAHYNSTAIHLAKQAVKYTRCPLRKDEGKDRYWSVLFVGKYASSDEKGIFIWKLRDELKEALESMGFWEVKYRNEEQTNMFKNVILYGPPGTGKTYYTVLYAVAIIEKADLSVIENEPYEAVLARYQKYKSDGLIEFTTFHQSYGYEDFIEGIKPVMDGEEADRQEITYKISSGLFKTFCERAGQPSSKNRNFVFVIDEINRGNISKIFGELITLIEPSKRIGQLEGICAKLPYSKKPFGVPNNVYLIGTMNTADRSIAAIDTALRRRFQFIEMQPDPDVLESISVEGISIKAMLTRMNKRISVLFDREHTIGHAYFMPLKKDNSLDTLAEIFENNIIPLLQEYFYDDYAKIRLILGDNRKTDAAVQFIIVKTTDDAELFGETDVDFDEIFSYEINRSAFHSIEAYQSI